MHTYSSRLAEHHTVGAHTFVLSGEEFSSTAHNRLDLVDKQQHAMLAADPRDFSEIAFGRHDDSALALDRLDQERSGVRRDRCLERRALSERNRLESWRERPEAVAVLRVRRKPNDGDRAAVEVVLANDDLGAPVGNALDAIAPFARRLERRLHRL